MDNQPAAVAIARSHPGAGILPLENSYHPVIIGESLINCHVPWNRLIFIIGNALTIPAMLRLNEYNILRAPVAGIEPDNILILFIRLIPQVEKNRRIERSPFRDEDADLLRKALPVGIAVINRLLNYPASDPVIDRFFAATAER